MEAPHDIEVSLQLLSGNSHVIRCLSSDTLYETVLRELVNAGVVRWPLAGDVFENESRNGTSKLKVVSCDFYGSDIQVASGDKSIGGGPPFGDDTSFEHHGVESGATLSVTVTDTPHTLDYFFGKVRYDSEMDYQGSVSEYQIFGGKWRCPGGSRSHFVKLATISPQRRCAACVDAGAGV
eukprot:TRINITY_DN109500_c0_g1_i1.p1 TRINITY_DN109500_c0_g1~~TRINITY_DN109500_c0_g1_i1.p1  ORF type:complete len:180 (-),score=17.55 TRINITY_DN109500_c0_g1_i1:231-770(-)